MNHSNTWPLVNGHRRELLKRLGATAAAATAGGWHPARASTPVAPRRGGRLRVAVMGMSVADSLDPAKGVHTGDYSRMFMFYSGLTEFDAHFNVVNGLADTLESDDATTWHVRLKPGVQFHDGRTLHAEDVAFSLTRQKDPATASKVKAMADTIASVRVIDPTQLDITLTAPNVDFPAYLAVLLFVIIARDTRDFATANGTGPFVCQTFTPGGRTLAVRNRNFWKPDRPWLDEVELIGVADESARLNALLAGDVDLITPVPAREVERILRNPAIRLLEAQSGLYSNLVLRQDAAPTNNPDFVQAIKYLHDRERIQTTLLRGYCTPGNDHPVPVWHPYFMPGLPQREFDLDRAKFHVNRAGLSGTRSEIVAAPMIEGALESAQMLQQAARLAGLDLAVRRVPADGYWSTHWMRHPITYGSILPRPTLDLLYTQFFKSDAPWNETGWHNAQFDELLLATRRERDDVRRKQLYGDMQTLIYEHCSLVIPAFVNFIDAHRSHVQGLQGSPSGRLMGWRFAESAWIDDAA